MYGFIEEVVEETGEIGGRKRKCRPREVRREVCVCSVQEVQ